MKFHVVVTGRKAGAIGLHGTERREYPLIEAESMEKACDAARSMAIDDGLEHTSIKFAKELP